MKVNSLDSVVEPSVNEGSEMFLNHAIHPFSQNGILGLKKLMTWVRPLFNCLLDEFLCDDKWVVIWELSRFRPELHLSNRIVDEGQVNSP